ncbi:4438_t:CDS:1 [Paraglomus brasilianum]|uniref:4438_t:CDS:1 n=1 Tax=Paraglomus brasilianum TaxID=144538 RepID=A0A9N9C6H4_9GLOM|nr:4438_t:CDS:1 [Paraglomus brasilianum]
MQAQITSKSSPQSLCYSTAACLFLTRDILPIPKLSDSLNKKLSIVLPSSRQPMGLYPSMRSLEWVDLMTTTVGPLASRRVHGMSLAGREAENRASRKKLGSL